jgi:nucleoid-associated protein YejK
MDQYFHAKKKEKKKTTTFFMIFNMASENLDHANRNYIVLQFIQELAKNNNKNIQTDLIIMDYCIGRYSINDLQQLFVCGLTERLGSRVGCFLVYHNIGVYKEGDGVVPYQKRQHHLQRY